MTTPLHQSWIDLLFFVALALLFSHELDAIPNAEWRVLPGLHLLPGEQGGLGYSVFLLLHIPLFALLMWWSASLNPVVRRRAHGGISVFMVLHTIVHFGVDWADHPHYTFHGWVSNGLILGAGLLAAVHLLLLFRQTPSR